METPAPEDTETELAILQLLWEKGPAPIRQLTQSLYPSGTASHYATVQKLLDRLELKGLVGRDRTSMTHIFRAIASRDDYIGSQLRAMADKLCGGSVTPLLTNLLQREQFTDDERNELRELLVRMSRPKK
jgi:predicted transcriptional regulator